MDRPARRHIRFRCSHHEPGGGRPGPSKTFCHKTHWGRSCSSLGIFRRLIVESFLCPDVSLASSVGAFSLRPWLDAGAGQQSLGLLDGRLTLPRCATLRWGRRLRRRGAEFFEGGARRENLSADPDGGQLSPPPRLASPTARSLKNAPCREALSPRLATSAGPRRTGCLKFPRTTYATQRKTPRFPRGSGWFGLLMRGYSVRATSRAFCSLASA